MEPRFNGFKSAPGAYKAMMGLEQYLHQCGLEESLLQGQVDHAVIRDGKDAESDIWFLNFTRLRGRLLSARHEAKRNDDARHQTRVEARTATPWPISPQRTKLNLFCHVVLLQVT